MEHKWDEAFGYLYGQVNNAKSTDFSANLVSTEILYSSTYQK